VADLSDIITVLQRGEVMAEGTYEEIARHPDVKRAYLGAAHE
jgi:branched-chain amino acid transport system ATP-binding protein